MTVLETFHSFLLLSCNNTSLVYKNQEWREYVNAGFQNYNQRLQIMNNSC